MWDCPEMSVMVANLDDMNMWLLKMEITSYVNKEEFRSGYGILEARHSLVI